MKQHARKAYDELKFKSIHVMPPETARANGYGGHFAIGIEPIDPKSLDDFGRWIHRMINTTIPKILEKHGLCSCWENGVVIGVYDKEA